MTTGTGIPNAVYWWPLGVSSKGTLPSLPDHLKSLGIDCVGIVPVDAGVSVPDAAVSEMQALTSLMAAHGMMAMVTLDGADVPRAPDGALGPAWVLEMLRTGAIGGVRVRGLENLEDPDSVLAALFAAAEKQSAPDVSPGCFVVVDRPLAPGERLPGHWSMASGSGHGFAALATAVLADAASADQFRNLVSRLAGFADDFSQILVDCKRHGLNTVFRPLVDDLVERLHRVCDQGVDGVPADVDALREVVVEVVAAFPIYRTHIRPGVIRISESDRAAVNIAFERVARSHPDINGRVFELVWRLLRQQDPEGLDETAIGERRAFVQRFQTVTGPSLKHGGDGMAASRYFPLVSACEPGAQPTRLAITVEEFHRENRQRLADAPRALASSRVSDSRLGEDVRARLAVLPEITAAWTRAITRWRSHNQTLRRSFGDGEIPTAAQEYLLYQALVGAWPIGGLATRPGFAAEVSRFMIATARTASGGDRHQDGHSESEALMATFVTTILDPNRRGSFLPEFERFHRIIEWAGYWNGLAQTLLKVVCPGIPDFQPGGETWDLSLGPAAGGDVSGLKTHIKALRRLMGRPDMAGIADALLKRPQDGRIKMWITQRVLTFRAQQPELFQFGKYLALEGVGAGAASADRMLALMREHQGRRVVAVVGRLFSRLGKNLRRPVGADAWHDVALALPKSLIGARFRDVLIDSPIVLDPQAPPDRLPLAQVFRHLPIALLEVSS